jgi:antitoxin PrlF
MASLVDDEGQNSREATILPFNTIVPLILIFQIFPKNLNYKRIDPRHKVQQMTAEDELECCSTQGKIGCCRVESIVTIDERGQMVLPKEIRERAMIRAGDKLAVLSLEKNGKICCLSLIKAEELESMVKSRLGPIMNEVFRQ